MPLSLSEADLTNERWMALQETFRPITPSGRVESFLRPTARDVIAAVLGRDVFGNNFRRARHLSSVRGIFINYFETWVAQVPKEKQRVYSLEKAYFHLDAAYPDGRGDEEILALHCDALIGPEDASYIYKRGPHFHISGNKRDISKSHIALCLSDLDHIYSDFEAYSNAFAGIIRMVADEVLPRL